MRPGSEDPVHPVEKDIEAGLEEPQVVLLPEVGADAQDRREIPLRLVRGHGVRRAWPPGVAQRLVEHRAGEVVADDPEGDRLAVPRGAAVVEDADVRDIVRKRSGGGKGERQGKCGKGAKNGTLL